MRKHNLSENFLKIELILDLGRIFPQPIFIPLLGILKFFFYSAAPFQKDNNDM